MVYNAQMIRFRPHIYIYEVYFIKGHFCPPLPPLRKGKGGRCPPPALPLSGVPDFYVICIALVGWALQICTHFFYFDKYQVQWNDVTKGLNHSPLIRSQSSCEEYESTPSKSVWKSERKLYTINACRLEAVKRGLWKKVLQIHFRDKHVGNIFFVA